MAFSLMVALIFTECIVKKFGCKEFEDKKKMIRKKCNQKCRDTKAKRKIHLHASGDNSTAPTQTEPVQDTTPASM